MRAPHGRGPGRGRLIGLFGVTLILAACSGTAASSAPSAAAPVTAAPAPSAAAPSEAAAASPSQNDKPLEIAYLSFAVANSYDAPMLAAAQAAAAAGNAKLTVFDAKLDPAQQTKQLQDAVASGKYDAIITQPLYGAGMVEDVKKAIAAGVAVGNIDQVLGADMNDADSQIPGLSATSRSSRASSAARSASSPSRPAPTSRPTRATSATSGRSRRRPSTGAQAAFDTAIASHPEIKVVADAVSPSTRRPRGLKAAQDIVTAHPDVSVIVGRRPGHHGCGPPRSGHQGQGRARRLRRRRHRPPGHRRRQALRDGDADARHRGGLGTEQLIQAIRTGTPAPGVDPLATLPDGGVVTKANVDTFLPLAEWPG